MKAIVLAVVLMMAGAAMGQTTQAVSANWIGVAMADYDTSTNAVALKGKSPRPKAVMVIDVAKNSPAEAGGIERNDLIFRIDGKPIVNKAELTELVAGATNGQSLKIDFFRLDEAADRWSFQSRAVVIAERPSGKPVFIHQAKAEEEAEQAAAAALAEKKASQLPFVAIDRPLLNIPETVVGDEHRPGLSARELAQYTALGFVQDKELTNKRTINSEAVRLRLKDFVKSDARGEGSELIKKNESVVAACLERMNKIGKTESRFVVCSSNDVPIVFTKDAAGNGLIFCSIAYGVKFNIQRTSLKQRAASTIRAMILPTALEVLGALENTDIAQVGFLVIYGSDDFTDRSRLDLEAEGVAVVMPVAQIKQLKAGYISDDDLIGFSQVFTADRDSKGRFRKSTIKLDQE